MGDVLKRSGLLEAEALVARSEDASWVHAAGLPADTLEGFLYPSTYTFPANATPEEMLKAFAAEYHRAFTDADRARAEAQGLNELEVVTLASLLELETPSAAERAYLSGVYHNRLKKGWRLESAPTLTFALEDPYNTFRSPGLPPGPICSPGPGALKAALEPLETDHLFVFRNGAGRIEVNLDADEDTTLLKSIRQDPAPKALVRDAHYWVSNELDHLHFREDLERLGGVYIGVGTDQNYLMAAWTRPDLLILMDFDQAVVNLHRVYRAAFLGAPTPEDFLKLWSEPKNVELKRYINEAYPTEWERKVARKALYAARWLVNDRLRSIKARYLARGIPCFLTDQEMYSFVVELHRRGRVIAVRGDLTGPNTMRDLGAVLKRHHRLVRTLYLSNAEQYFPYSKQYRRNILELPYDARSIVLRTRPVGKDYVYVVQPLENFRYWLEQPSVTNVRKIVPRRGLSAAVPLVRIETLPPSKSGHNANSSHK